MTTDQTAAAPDTEEPRRRGPGTALVTVLALLAVAAVAFGAFVLVDHNQGSSSGAEDTAFQSMRRACTEWQSSTGMHGADASWCDSMTTWMRARVRAGTMPMGMMWGDAAGVREACRQWASQEGSSDDATRCDDMLQWMQQHAGTWNSWMHGSMMG